MSRYQSYINTAVKIIEAYKGETSLALFLKHFFSKEKKYGSRDRKQVASLCYYYFRVGHAAKRTTIEEKILIGCFLCEKASSELLQYKRPEWNSKAGLPFNQKTDLIQNIFLIKEVFPFTDELSGEIDSEKFCRSFFIQPDLFLRIRPKVKVAVMRKLDHAAVSYQLSGDDCIVLPNTTKAEEIFVIDKEVVVQDLNSQQVLNYLRPGTTGLTEKLFGSSAVLNAWDCCAASGGKSILLYDLLNGKTNLTVSDIRPNMLSNLQQRFKKAGISKYKYFVADVSSGGFDFPAKDQDMIICDVPCTGSGTWSRTPEQLYFFDPSVITEFSKRQQQMVENVVPRLVKGGLLIYITCSVFEKENEVVVDFIREGLSLQLLHKELLKGDDKRADSMFVAIFRK